MLVYSQNNKAVEILRSSKVFDLLIFLGNARLTPWRNGSASDSRSEGCVFESRRGQRKFSSFFFFFLPFFFLLIQIYL